MNIGEVYNIGKEIGSGRYGIVNLCAKKSYAKKRYASKKIDRDQIKTDIQMLERELEILQDVDHPNIIDFYEIFMDDTHFHFITQLCEGGELF